MAFGVGDIVPYSQLPGGVAGQQAPQIMQGFQQGQLGAAQLEEAMSKAQQQDIQAKMMVARLPQEMMMKNIQDAQSINTVPPKPGLDDYNQAQKDVLGDNIDDNGNPLVADKDGNMKPREMTGMERHKVELRAQELAHERTPQFDVHNPMPYLEQVQPVSNREMDLEKMQAMIGGRYGVADLNNDAKWQREQSALGVKQSEGDKNRTSRETVAGTYAGAGIAPGGAVPLKTQKTTDSMESAFLKTERAGQIISQERPENAKAYFDKNPQLGDSLAKFIFNVDRMGDHQKAQQYYQKYKALLPANMPPPGSGRAPKSVGDATPYSQDDMSSQAPMVPKVPKHQSTRSVVPASNDQPASYSPDHQFGPDLPNGPNGPLPGQGQELGSPGNQPRAYVTKDKVVPKIVTINGQAYGVGDPLSLGGRNYIVIEGKNGLGRLKRAD